jgi:hypothetical protein
MFTRKSKHWGQALLVACSVAVLFTAFSSTASAQQGSDKKTRVTFNVPVEIPGISAQVLPAGTYVFKLMDSPADRHIVQIFSADESHHYANILAIPNWRLRPSDKTVMTFSERAAGQPQAIRAWFYPGDNFGQEFVYPKTKAVELAKVTNLPVLYIPDEVAPSIVAPVRVVTEPAVVALVRAPLRLSNLRSGCSTSASRRSAAGPDRRSSAENRQQCAVPGVDGVFVPRCWFFSSTAVRALVLIALVGLALSPHPRAASIPARAPAQGGERGHYSIVVDVDLVVFNVTVTDNRGRQVAGLKASDFQIREANRFQDIKLFAAESAPATVGLVIDNSGSMQNKRANVVDAALAFAGASHPDDELFLLNFNERVSFGLPSSTPFTSSFAAMRSALLSTRADGMTALYDALVAGIEHLKAGTRDRQVLVVLSDGGDNASRRSLDDVLGIAQRSNATIYAIGIYDENNPDRNPRVLRESRT